MKKLSSLLLIFVMAMAVPLFASEQKVKFEWSYPNDQSTIINGFRIYRMTTPPTLLVEIKDGTMRVYEVAVDLVAGKNNFYVVPFIGDKEGIPSDTKTIEISPFVKIDKFNATCKSCK